jgi:hypothetical protein
MKATGLFIEMKARENHLKTTVNQSDTAEAPTTSKALSSMLSKNKPKKNDNL